MTRPFTRRSFLALLGSAPIAALVPWSKMMAAKPKQRLPIGHPSCNCKHCVLMRQYRDGKMSEMAGFDWYMDPEPKVFASSEVAVDMPAEAARLRQALAEALDATTN